MGLLDKLLGGGGPTEKQISKMLARVKEGYGDPGRRLEAVETLVEWGTPESLRAVLKRFDYSSQSSGSPDMEEKKHLYGLLVELGENGVEPLVGFLAKGKELGWPLKVLKDLVPEEEFVSHVIKTLGDVDHSPFYAAGVSRRPDLVLLLV